MDNNDTAAPLVQRLRGSIRVWCASLVFCALACSFSKYVLHRATANVSHQPILLQLGAFDEVILDAALSKPLIHTVQVPSM
jgi:hypothetical protein